MAKEKITRGQELYFRHLSLFSKAVPLTIKATIRKLIDQNGQSLNNVLTGKKEHIQTFNKDLYQVLFADSSENIESQIHTLNIKTLCEIVFVLIDQPKIDCIKCIFDQRLDLENYASSVSLDYKTFQHKWNALEKSLLTLCSDTDVKFECTRLIHSFDELKGINKDVYENLKSTKDVNKHIQIATENLDSQTGAESLKVKKEVKNTVYAEDTSNIREIADNSKVKDLPNVGAENKETVEIVKHLSNQVLNAGESVALVCKLNTDECQVSWSKNGEILTDTETVDILASKGSHFLIIQTATTEDSGTYSCTYRDLFTSASVIVSNQDLHIIKPLQIDGDGDVIKYMKVSFSCSCNIPQKTPRWFHNNKEIEGNDVRVTAVSKEYEHKLIIHHVELSDEGEYMVVFDRVISSKTSISVKDLLISKPLHVNVDGDIREYMKISLSCTINIPRATPKWFHNNKEIEENNKRVSIVSSDCEYKLIIHHVEFADEGEYTVVFGKMTLKTSITVKGHLNLTIKHQIQEELHKNWIRGVLALKYLKLGLDSPAEKAVISHHKQILEALPKTVSKKACLECNSENLLPHLKKQCPRTQSMHKCLCSRNPHRRRLCPSNELCSEIYDLIVRDHRFGDPALINTSMDQWRSDPWSIAACYTSNTESIHTSQYRRKQSSKELDCAELLSLFVNNRAYLPNTNYGVFDMARIHRNNLMHNPNSEISNETLREYLVDFREVLEVIKKSNEMMFPHFVEVEQSLKALDDLQNYQIDINTKQGIEKNNRAIQTEAMHEDTDTDNIETAFRQKAKELQELRENLKGRVQEGKL